MNKVWLVFEVVPYEGNTLVGVYATEAVASTVYQALKLVGRAYDYHIEEHEIKHV